MLKSISSGAPGSADVSLTSPVEIRAVDPQHDQAEPLADRVPLRLVGGDHVHVALRAILIPRRPAQSREHLPAQRLRQSRAGLEPASEVDAGVLHQVLADAGLVERNGNAKLSQFARGADAGAHQQRRRLQRAGGKHGLAGTQFEAFAAAAHRDAHSPQAVEQNSLDMRIAHDREIGPLPHRPGEIAPRHSHALVIGVAMRDRRETVGERAVLVLDVAPAGPLDGGQHAAREARPRALRIALDVDRPVLAVQRAVEVAIGFQLLEERQHLVPRPADRAALDPVRIVRRQAAQGRHAVDRRGASDHPALVVEAPRPGVRRVAGPRRELRRAVRPDEARIGVGRRAVDIEDFRRLLAGRIVGARLDQQDTVAAVLRKPCRQHAAGRAGADHDEVIWIGQLHPAEVPSPFKTSVAPPAVRARPWPGPWPAVRRHA